MTLGINESENIKAPLPDGWKTIPLSNFPIEYGDGLTKRNRGGGSIPVYGSNGIVGWHTTALTNGPTIIIGRKGSVGAVHLSTVTLITNFFIIFYAHKQSLIWIHQQLSQVLIAMTWEKSQYPNHLLTNNAALWPNSKPSSPKHAQPA